SFWAVLCFGRYLDTERLLPALGFGMFASLALMVKGTGFIPALVPPLALLFSGRFRLLASFSFWSPALLVGALCFPWYWTTLGANRQRIVEPEASFVRHSVTPGNVGRNRHHSRWLVSVPGRAIHQKHRRGVAGAAAGQAAHCVFPWRFAGFPVYSPAATRGHSQRRSESERAPKRPGQHLPPPPISTMRCRSEPTETLRYAVGKSSTMRCRS